MNKLPTHIYLSLYYIDTLVNNEWKHTITLLCPVWHQCTQYIQTAVEWPRLCRCHTINCGSSADHSSQGDPYLMQSILQKHIIEEPTSKSSPLPEGHQTQITGTGHEIHLLGSVWGGTIWFRIFSSYRERSGSDMYDGRCKSERHRGTCGGEQSTEDTSNVNQATQTLMTPPEQCLIRKQRWK